MPDILVLDLWSVLDIGDNVSNGISWIPSNCFDNGDSLSCESLAYDMHKIRQMLGVCHNVRSLCEILWVIALKQNTQHIPLCLVHMFANLV